MALRFGNNHKGKATTQDFGCIQQIIVSVRERERDFLLLLLLLLLLMKLFGLICVILINFKNIKINDYVNF
jgi:hypothetical protein